MVTVEEIFQQANNHLIETDKKRDQIIAFFAVIMGIYLNFIKDTFSIERNIVPGDNQGILILIDIFFVLFGIMLGIVIIHYRKWHSLYVYTANTLSYLSINHYQGNTVIITHDTLQEAWSFVNESRKSSKASLFPSLKSTEFWIFFAYSIFSSLPLYLLLYHSRMYPLSLQYLYQPLIGYLTMMFIFDYLFNRMQVQNQAYDVSWLLRLVKPEPGN